MPSDTDDREWDDPELSETEDIDPYTKGIAHGFVYTLLMQLAIVGLWFLVTQFVL